MTFKTSTLSIPRDVWTWLNDMRQTRYEEQRKAWRADNVPMRIMRIKP